MQGCVTGFRRALYEGQEWDYPDVGMFHDEMPTGSPYSQETA